MLKVCFQAITTGQKIWSRFPAPRQTIREMSGQLGMNAAKIVEVESDGSVFAPYLIGKEVPPEKGYKEVDFLERRMATEPVRATSLIPKRCSRLRIWDIRSR